VVVSHGSQVLGTVQPVGRIAEICRGKGIPLLVDAAQTAGQVPVDMGAIGASAVAFTGHKALLGPSGSGGLVFAPDLDIASTRFGGTGIDSHSLRHTQSFPHRLEAGTLNLLGIIGLSIGLEQVEREGMERIHAREMALVRRLREGLRALPGVTVYSPPPQDGDLPVLTCNVEGIVSDDVGAILDGDYGIAVRSGIHCAPLAHADLGTGERGSVRFSLGHGSTDADIDAALEAMAAIAGSR
jgi:cysteine desulfurase/selenocysteine lyase